jgi:shikimate kinase
VIATGGGATTVSANVAVMRATGTAVWLDPPFEVILDRLDSTGRRTRPLFSSPAEARALFQERRVSYSVADIRLAVAAGESASGVAERVLRALLGANSGVSNGDRGT